MPKQKTHSGSKKRFKVTGTGKVMRCHLYTGICTSINWCNKCWKQNETRRKKINTKFSTKNRQIKKSWKKKQKQNRQLRGETFVSTSDLRRIRQMISNL